MGNMVILDKIEDLCFIYIPGIGQGVKDPIRIKGEVLSVSLGDIILFVLDLFIDLLEILFPVRMQASLNLFNMVDSFNRRSPSFFYLHDMPF